MRRFAVLGCILVALTLYLPQPAAAQDRPVELFAGYSFLSNDDLAVNQSTLPWGFVAGAEVEMTELFSLAFELSGHYKNGITPSTDTSRVVAPDPTQDFQAFSFNRAEIDWCSARIQDCDVDTVMIGGVVGPRFHLLETGRARPYFHFMAGATRALRKIAFFAHTATNFTIQPGAGVDIDMRDNMALRIQGDYRRVFFPTPDQTDPGASLVSKDGDDYQDFVLNVGVVFRLNGQ